MKVATARARALQPRFGMTASLFISLTGLAVLVSGTFWGIARWNAQYHEEAQAARTLETAIDQAELNLRRQVLPVFDGLSFWGLQLTSNPSEEAGQEQWPVFARGWFQRMPQVKAIHIARPQGSHMAFVQETGLCHVFHGMNEAVRWTHLDATGKETASSSLDTERWERENGTPWQQSWYTGAVEMMQRGMTEAFWIGLAPATPPSTEVPLRISLAVPGTTGIYVLAADLILDGNQLPATEAGQPQTQIFDSRVNALGSGESIGPALFPGKDSKTENADSEAFAAALKQWQANNITSGVLYQTDALHEWAYSFQQCAFPGDILFWVSARIERSQFSRPLDNKAIVGLLSGLLLAALIAHTLSRMYARPMHALALRLQSLETLRSARGTWPKSRVREIHQLTESCKGVLRQIDRNAREMARAQAPESGLTSGLEPIDRVNAIVLEYQQQENAAQHGRVAESDNSRTAEPETSQAVPHAEPPRAFVQAMHSTRKQLSSTELRLNAVYQEFEALAERTRTHEQRLFAQRKALGMLSREFVTSSQSPAESFAHLLGLAVRTLNIQASGIWLINENQDRFSCLMRFDGISQTQGPGGALQRSDCPVFFIAAESQDIIRVRDAASDPRAPRLPVATDGSPAPDALLITPIFTVGGLRGILCHEHTGGIRTWTVDEENFALALAQFAAHRIASGTAGEEAQHFAQQVATGRGIAAIDLHEEAPMYRWVLDSAGWIVWALNSAGTITYANLAAEEAYGCDVMELAGRTVSDFAAEGSRHADMQALRRVMAGEAAYVYETEHVGASEKPMLLRVTLTLLQDETGAEMGAVGVAEDITELRREERALLERLAHYRGLVEGSPQVIWSADAIGCITFVNPAVQRVYGYTPKELIGQPLTMLGWENQGQRDLDRLYRLLAGTACTGYHTIHRTKDGRCIRIAVTAEARRDEQGRVNGALGFAMPEETESENDSSDRIN